MKTLVRFAILAVCGAILGGCVATAVDIQPDPLRVKVRRLALFYRAAIPEIGPDGIKGYAGRADDKALQAVVDAAVKAAMKGGKP